MAWMTRATLFTAADGDRALGPGSSPARHAPSSGGGSGRDAAPVWCGVELGDETAAAESFDDASYQTEVHAAHETGVLARK